MFYMLSCHSSNSPHMIDNICHTLLYHQIQLFGQRKIIFSINLAWSELVHVENTSITGFWCGWFDYFNTQAVDNIPETI